MNSFPELHPHYLISVNLCLIVLKTPQKTETFKMHALVDILVPTPPHVNRTLCGFVAVYLFRSCIEDWCPSISK